MLHTCLILNGPPNCGKDTLAHRLEDFGFHKHQFKDQLYIDTAKLFGMPLGILKQIATDRELKELPDPRLMLNGEAISPRQALIHTSEDVIKPNHSKEYFGEAAARNCREAGSYLAVFSDGGFPEEMEPMRRAYKNVVIIRLHRDGCDFSNDSRDYMKGFGHTYDLELVDGEIRLAVKQILDIMDPYLPRFGELKLSA